MSKILLPLCIIALFGLAACSLAEDITPPPGYQSPTAAQPVASGPAYPLVAPNPAQGADLYAQHCLACHGASGMGDGPQASRLANPVPAIGTANLARQSTPAQWFTMISQGNLQNFMPGFASILSDGERWNVLSYVYSLSAPADMIAQGKEIYSKQCAACHGPGGKGDGPQAASLSTQPIDLSNQAKLSEVSLNDLYQVVTNGAQQVMPAYKDKLSDDQRWAVSAYLRTFTLGNGSPANQQASAATQGSPAQPSNVTPPAGTSIAPAGTQPAAQGTQASGQPTGQAAAAGTVTGKVTNGTGGPLPSGLIVTLHGYDGMQETYTKTAPLKADGTYRFENVEMVSGRVFVTSVDFNRATFNSDVAHSQNSKSPINLPISIFDSTTDKTTLSVDRMHVFFDFSTPQVVQVVELFVISNSGQKTVVAPSGQAVLTFDLPDGASNLQFQDGSLGSRYIQTPKGFGDTAGVAPGSGQHQVLFAYDMPYTGKLDLHLPIPLPVTAAIVMSPDPSVKIQSSQLQDSGQQNVQGMSFHAFSSGSLPAGQTLNVSLSGQAGQTGGASTGSLIPGASNIDLIIGIGTLGLALVIAGVLILRRSRLNAQPAGGPSLPAGGADNEDSDTLVDAIIALDEKYRAGEIPESAYKLRRTELKARLRDKLGQ